MKKLIFHFLILCFISASASQAQILKDDFNRSASTDVSGSRKWRRVLDLNDTSATIQLNSDSTISPRNLLGPFNRGGVYWDSALSGRFQIGAVLRHKNGNDGVPSFHLQVMDDSSWQTGNGYAMRFQANPGQDRIDIQRITGSGVDTPTVNLLADLSREFLEGDTLIFKVYPDGRKTAAYYSVNGERDSISVVDIVHDPPVWFGLIQGRVFADPVKMDNFMIGPIPYRVTASAGPGGSIDPAGIVTVDSGGSVIYSITPVPGFFIDDVLVNAVSVGPTAGYMFAGVASDQTIEAFFAPYDHAITAIAGPHGSISPAGTVYANSGDTVSFSVAAQAGYHVDSVTVDGVNKGAVSNYAICGVTANHLVRAFFSINVFTVTATASAGGSLSPSGPVHVNYGSNKSFTVNPDFGYHIDSVRVDGVNLGAIAGYTFTNVTANHTIRAWFSIDVFTITATSSAGGSISPQGVINVDCSSSQSFAMTPDPHYHVDSVLVDGVNQGVLAAYTFTDVTANHTIAAYFSIDVYTITATASSGGTIAPAGAVSATYGSNRSFTIAPNTGYHIDSVVADGVNLGAVAGHDFLNVTANHAIDAYFSINVYTITATASAGGSLAPSGSVNVNYGSNQSFSVTPAVGYHIDSVVADGVNLGAVANHDFLNVMANHAIDAYFSIDVFTVAATASAGGSISPAGAVNVHYGANPSFSVTPNTGYHIDSVVADGVNLGAVAGHDFTNVTANHTIDAYFSIDVFTVTATASAGGSISPSGALSVNYGGNQSLSISPDAGFHIDSVVADGVNLGAVTGHDFTNVTANHTIAAWFSINIYVVTAGAGAGGSITPSGPVPVSHGGDLTFTVTPDTGYFIADVHVDSVSVGPVGTYAFNAVTAAHTIEATFSLTQYTITATASAGGSISPSGAVGASHGDDRSFTMSPNAGYHLDSVLVDGVSQGAPAGYDFINITASHTISAHFSINMYAITASAGAGGGIAPSGTVSVAHGADQSFTITPATGYDVVDVHVDTVSVGAVAGYTFTNVTANHTIAATFALQTFTIEAIAGANGSVSPAGTTVADYGDTLSVTITPDSGYFVADVFVDSVSVGAVASYTFTGVSANHLLVASFSTNALPAAVSLLSPLDGDTIVEGSLVALSFGWTPSTDADAGDTLLYSLHITGPGVDYTAGGLTDTGVTLDLSAVLAAGDDYAWTVSVTDGEAVVASPDTFAFHVSPATGVDEAGDLPRAYALGQNYPNPFNPTTAIPFDLPERSDVTLKVFNILGVEVMDLASGEQMQAGSYRRSVDFSGLATGAYFYRLSARGESGRVFEKVMKLVVIR